MSGIVICSFMTSGSDHDIVQIAAGRLALPECVLVSMLSSTVAPPDRKLRAGERIDSDKANAVSRDLARRTGVSLQAFGAAMARAGLDSGTVYVRTPWHAEVLKENFTNLDIKSFPSSRGYYDYVSASGNTRYDAAQDIITMAKWLKAKVRQA